MQNLHKEREVCFACYPPRVRLNFDACFAVPGIRKERKPKATEWTRSALALRPSAVETRRMVRQLWRRWGRDQTADVLGVPVATLEDWAFSAAKAPSRAARKLVWLVWCLEFHPERCRTMFDVMTWGRFRR